MIMYLKKKKKAQMQVIKSQKLSWIISTMNKADLTVNFVKAETYLPESSTVPGR